MIDALRREQTIVVLGATSDIGRAITAEMLHDGVTHLVLAARHPEDVDTSLFIAPSARISVERFDALDTSEHGALFRRIADRVGDIDTVICAWGVLGDQHEFEVDPERAVEAARVNYVGVVSVVMHAAQLLRRQGHGRIIVLGSVAGERVRADNYVYGSTKAGVAGLLDGLTDALVGTGVDVTIVKPGFVSSSMTAGLDPAPFATTPKAVAKRVARGVRAGDDTVWAPASLRAVFGVIRWLPRPLFRRLRR